MLPNVLLRNSHPTEDAVVKRINRRLAKNGEVLRRSRTAQGWLDCGYAYVVDISVNGIIAKDIHIEAFAREIGVLAESEQMCEGQR